MPTLMARGDMYWEAGNRILAVALYRRALGQVGSSDALGTTLDGVPVPRASASNPTVALM